MKICKEKHGEVDIGKEEQIWYIVLDLILEFKKDEAMKKKSCSVFLKKRILLFSKEML